MLALTAVLVHCHICSLYDKLSWAWGYINTGKQISWLRPKVKHVSVAFKHRSPQWRKWKCHLVPHSQHSLPFCHLVRGNLILLPRAENSCVVSSTLRAKAGHWELSLDSSWGFDRLLSVMPAWRTPPWDIPWVRKERRREEEEEENNI